MATGAVGSVLRNIAQESMGSVGPLELSRRVSQASVQESKQQLSETTSRVNNLLSQQLKAQGIGTGIDTEA